MSKSVNIKHFSDCSGVGIDVSKAELVLGAFQGKEKLIFRLPNNKNKILNCLKVLKSEGFLGTLICESTGHYHLALALACSELDIVLIILNPIQASKHSKAKVRKLKTDPQDALVLATMLLTEPDLPAPSQLNADKILSRLKQGQLASLEKQIQKAQLSGAQYKETYKELGFELSEFQVEIEELVKTMKRLKRKLELELEQLLTAQLSEDVPFKEVTQIPGYSNIVAALVSALKRDVTSDNSWVAFVGLDVSIRESGTWKGRGKLTKRGNAYMRKRLYQAAWGACLNYPYVKQYYLKLKEQGRNHVEAVNILARKQLRIAYQIIVNGRKFDRNIAFP